MSQSYWDRTLAQRFSRRRALAVTGGTAVGAALLAACGGGSSDSGDKGGPKDTSGLTTPPTDTTSQAVRGGTFKRNNTADAPQLDPMLNVTPMVPFYETAYGRLVGFKPGHLASAQEDQVDGDAAESWEFSPDRLQITLKLRPDYKWHNIAPVNGRDVDTEDVLYTWNRFATKGNSRTNLANVANPDAPILSVTAPDSKTIVIKLKDPIVYALSMFGARENVNLTAKEEGSGGFEARNKIIGTGPYYVSNYTPSLGFTMKRHEGYYDKNIAFFDQIDYPIITEYATMTSQFRAGNLHVPNPAIRQEEVIGFKKDVPDINMYIGDFLNTGNKLIFGWRTAALRDERVRQAFSMSYDRDTWIEVWNNTSKFEDLGIPMERRWMSALPSITTTYDGWRVEPRDPKSFGPNQKFFQYNIAEAKKLLAAAGFPNGIDLTSTRISGTEYGVDFAKQVEVREGMNAEAGIRLTPHLIDYQTEFIPQYRDTKGDFEGIAYRSGPPATSADPVGQYTFFYYSKAGYSFYGFDGASKGDHSGDPFVDSTIVKAQQEIDTEKRRGLINDLDKYLGGKMYAVNGLGGANGFNLAWPAIANYYVWRGGGANTSRIQNAYYWLDQTKAPKKS